MKKRLVRTGRKVLYVGRWIFVIGLACFVALGLSVQYGSFMTSVR